MTPEERARQWEQVLSRAARQAPDCRAPETLAPRVMAALAARAKPWWRCAWQEWPAAARTAAGALLAILAAGFLLAVQLAPELVPATVSSALSGLTALAEAAGALGAAAALVFNLFQPYITVLLLGIALTYALAAAGTALLYRAAGGYR